MSLRSGPDQSKDHFVFNKDSVGATRRCRRPYCNQVLDVITLINEIKSETVITFAIKCNKLQTEWDNIRPLMIWRYGNVIYDLSNLWLNN